MRRLAILTATLLVATALATALLIRAGSHSSAHAAPHAKPHPEPRPKALPHPDAAPHRGPDAARHRVQLGIISYNLSQFALNTGIHPGLTAKYLDWGSSFPASTVRADHRLGATTLIVLEPRSIGPRRVAAGRGDGFLARWAAAERKLGLPIMLSFAPEANGIWYPWGKGHISPALYIKMYRHVHNVLLRDGVRHVSWLWQVDRISGQTEPLSRLWPGPSYVNTVGLDGQLAYGKANFDKVFGPTFAEVRAFTRAPVMLSEVAVAKGPARARQITALFATARAEHLTALNFFDVPPWNFDHDRPALKALRAATRAK